MTTRSLDTPTKHAFVCSALAKSRVFDAQDAANLIDDEALRHRVETEFSAARAHLEAADRVLRDAMMQSR